MTTRHWFITGTSSGFGRALTEQLLENGDYVFATLRKPEALNDLKARYDEHLRVAALDVTDVLAIRRVVGQALRDLGRIDVRRAAGELRTPGGPLKMVKAMIASVHQSPAPKRLAQGYAKRRWHIFGHTSPSIAGWPLSTALRL